MCTAPSVYVLLSQQFEFLLNQLALWGVPFTFIDMCMRIRPLKISHAKPEYYIYIYKGLYFDFLLTKDHF